MHNDFSIIDQTLVINAQTQNLEAFRWNAPNKVPVYFVFAGNLVHIITLDDQEEPFQKVCSLTQTVPVRLVTDEEVEQYDLLHKQNALAAV
mgnify:CR=1 FL=1